MEKLNEWLNEIASILEANLTNFFNDFSLSLDTIITILFVFFAFIYFIPTIIASARNVYKKREIFLLNLFLAWTVFFWFACLYLALTNSSMSEKSKRYPKHQEYASNESKKQLPNFYPYERIPLFSSNERQFYYPLRDVATRMGYILFAKVRIADIVKVKGHINNFNVYFGYISQKHVDFVLCSQNLNVVLVIELDDSSHLEENRKDRDKLVDGVFDEAGIKIIHIVTSEINTSEYSIETYITNCINKALTQRVDTE